MRDLIERLIEVEDLAQRTYGAAAQSFAGTVGIVDFLEHQAEDEGLHRLTLQHALAILDSGDSRIAPSAFGTDPETAQVAVAALTGLQEKLAGTGGISPAELAALVETAESSEWNDLFLYVMEVLQSLGREFEVAAAEIQEHRESVDRFVRLVGDARTAPGPLATIRNVWTPTLLVVDDEPAITRLLEAIFRKEYRVLLAANGREALDLLVARHFDAIISDIDMPVLDGIECFRKAVVLDPSIRGRFVFHAGMEGHGAFLEAEGVPLLVKPSPISEIRRTVRTIVEHAHLGTRRHAV